MQDGIVGVYPGPGDQTFVTFRKGDEGLPLKRFLPSSAQGEGYNDFPIAGYFDYCLMWLATPPQWKELGTGAKLAGLGKSSPVKLPAPRLDFSAYDAIKPDGAVDNEHIEQLFSVFRRLWDHEPLISPQAGLFHNLYRTGLTPEEIIHHITLKATEGVANEQGVLQLDRVNPSASFRNSSEKTLASAAGRASAKQLKKKRKQGRLNRKRGRR